ncbi:MAG: cyclic-di-AMP receptor, partial [Candidatus Phytoplasma australasiaticum]|nr:cyclic-di-AMP receptor [Candidatus Phytoplasma australasiaticum]
MNKKMKLILAIVSSEDADEVQHNLSKNKFFITRLSKQVGFLSKINVTLIIGLSVDKVEQAIEIIRFHSRQKTQIIPNDILNEFSAYY